MRTLIFMLISVLACCTAAGCGHDAARRGEQMASDFSRLSGGPSSIQAYALRLKPGDDLRGGIEGFAREKGLKAGAIVTCVGSLSEAKLRLANAEHFAEFAGPMEIVSLVGTLSQDGVHLHISLSDLEGRTIGGHVVEGCIIYTTAEIVIVELDGLSFSRKPDAATGYKELFIDILPRAES